jgi:hypothetical protein
LQTNRIHNVSLFVTVLSACLLAVGAPAQAYAQPAQSVELFTAARENTEGVDEVQRKTRRSLYPSLLLRPARTFVFDRNAHAPLFPENTRPLNGNLSLRIVTRLPRAALAS